MPRCQLGGRADRDACHADCYTLFFQVVKGSDDHLPVDFDDAFNLDGENLIILILAELAGEAGSLGLILADFLAILIVASLGDEAAVDLRAAVVVVPLVGDDVGEDQPLAPRQASVLSREGAILALLLHRLDVVIVDAQAGLEGGFLEDFRLPLADLHRADSLEGDDLTLDCQHAGDLGGDGGGDGCVAHGGYPSEAGFTVKGFPVERGCWAGGLFPCRMCINIQAGRISQ